MSSIDTSVIIENLTELLQNTVNMTSVFYDIFLNPTPMDVELKQYNSNGDLVTITIPNRAKDRSIALTGTGSPEGTVTANIGTSYVDTTSDTVYFKATGTGNTGWVIVLTQEGVETYIRAYLTNNNFMTEDDVNGYLINNNYVTTSSLATALDAYKPTIPMSTMTTSGTVVLEDNSGYAITATGNITFQLPTVTDLTILHFCDNFLYPHLQRRDIGRHQAASPQSTDSRRAYDKNRSPLHSSDTKSTFLPKSPVRYSCRAKVL